MQPTNTLSKISNSTHVRVFACLFPISNVSPRMCCPANYFLFCRIHFLLSLLLECTSQDLYFFILFTISALGTESVTCSTEPTASPNHGAFTLKSDLESQASGGTMLSYRQDPGLQVREPGPPSPAPRDQLNHCTEISETNIFVHLFLPEAVKMTLRSSTSEDTPKFLWPGQGDWAPGNGWRNRMPPAASLYTQDQENHVCFLPHAN